MGRKRRYLFTNEAIPRRSQYRRRKKEEALSQNCLRLNNKELLGVDGPSSNSLVCLASLQSDCRSISHPLSLHVDVEPSNVNGKSSIDIRDSVEDDNGAVSTDDSSPEEQDSCSSTDVSACVNGDVDSGVLPQNEDIYKVGSSCLLNTQIENFDESPAIVIASDTEDNEHPVIGESKILLSNTLCPCAPTTEGDVLMMCLSYGVRHNLSWIAMVDLLKMINQIFGYEAVHASKYFLHKFLEVDTASSTFHIYCPKCEAYIGTRDKINHKEPLLCECGENIKNFDKNTSYFLSVDLENQLKQLLQLPNIAHEIMTYRFQRSKINENALEDIFDGAVYKRKSSPGSVLSDPLNFSYTFNTDGVSLGESSPNSVWPIYAFINELPPKLRWKHMVFAGIWVGQKDPNMRLFLKPFVEEANRLSTEGVHWRDANGTDHVSRVIPLCAVVDSAARYKLLNMSSFHAYDGCTFCYHRSSNTRVGRRYLISDNIVPLRTHESILEDMSQAFQNRDNKDKKKRIVKGQKGPSPLIKMQHLDLGEAFVVDFMHSVLLGNVRTHINNLLTAYGKPYYIGSPSTMHWINERLLSIKPPKSITRPPRPLKLAKFWKASEWRSFILFYCIVCLKGKMEEEYLAHLALLSSAMYILLQNSIVVEDIQTAERYLLKYVFFTQKYFGETAMLYNVHLLLHITKGVYDWGPLWTHNAFDFEGNNHKLVQMHTSPGYVAQQLTRRYLIFNSLPSHCEKYASTEGSLRYIKKITGKELKFYFRCGETVLLGKGKHFLPQEEAALTLNSVNIATNNIQVFSKMVSKGVRYCCSAYSQDKATDDSYIQLSKGKTGRIENILLTQGFNASIVLLVRQLVLDRTPVLKSTHVTVTHIRRVLKTGELVAIKPLDIKGQCVYMAVDHGKYITNVPFGCLRD